MCKVRISIFHSTHEIVVQASCVSASLSLEAKLTSVGITVGGYTLGCFFGAVATIWLGNMLGRRKTIFTGSAIMVVGAALQCSSFSLGQLIAARLITGFGNGMVCVCSLPDSTESRIDAFLEHLDCADLAI